MRIIITDVIHDLGLRRPKHGYGKVKVFLHPENESVMENYLDGRFTRPKELLRTILWEAVAEAVRQGAKFSGDLDNPKATWSQKAGCQCSCSPGFITNLMGYEDVFVDYKITT